MPLLVAAARVEGGHQREQADGERWPGGAYPHPNPPRAGPATLVRGLRSARGGAPRRVPVHTRHPRRRLRLAAVDDAPVRGFRVGRGDQRALPPAARARADGALGRVRPADAARPRLGRSAGARRGGPDGCRDRLARRHAAAVRRHPAGRGLDVDDDQRPRGRPPAALRAGRRGARRPAGAAARHGAERRAQGVRRARQLHLPAAPVDAPDGRPLPLLQRAPAALQHDLDLRLPHPRGRLERGAGARVHARQRHRLRRGGGRRRPRGRRLRAASLVLLQRPQRRLRGGREVPRGAPDLGHAHARALRRARRALARPALPRPDRRLDADRPGPAQQRRARRAAGVRRDGRRLPVAAHERLRRGARPAHRALGDDRAAHAAGAAARVRRRERPRPVRRLGVRRGADRRHRGGGAADHRRGRRARRRRRGDRERLGQGPDRGRGVRAAARDRAGHDGHRGRESLLPIRPTRTSSCSPSRRPASRRRSSAWRPCARDGTRPRASGRWPRSRPRRPMRRSRCSSRCGPPSPRRCTVGEVCRALKGEWGSYDAQISDGR